MNLVATASSLWMNGVARRKLHMSRRSQNSSSNANNQPDLFSFAAQNSPLARLKVVSDRAESNERGELAAQRSQLVGEAMADAQPFVVRSAAEPKPVVEPHESRHLLDVRAAAAWLGLSKSTLDKMRCYGTGPRFIRATCRAVRYDPDDLREFAQARRQSPLEGM
jgi:hypothetical protein